MAQGRQGEEEWLVGWEKNQESMISKKPSKESDFGEERSSKMRLRTD
jgi:hypothetical protein